MCGSDIFLGLVAILFPPLAVWVKRGICSADSLINIALCCLGFLPDLIHAWYIIVTTPDPTYDQLPQDPESGRVTYYVRTQPPQNGGRGGAGRPAGYGTVSSVPSSQFPQQQNQGFVQPPVNESAGPSAGEPPSYQQAIAGDNKVQTK